MSNSPTASTSIDLATRTEFAANVESHLHKVQTVSEAIKLAGDGIENSGLKRVAVWMHTDLEAGALLSAVAAKYPTLFSPTIVDQIRDIEGDHRIENRMDYLDAVATVFDNIAKSTE